MCYFFNIVDENTNFFEIMKEEKDIIQSLRKNYES